MDLRHRLTCAVQAALESLHTSGVFTGDVPTARLEPPRQASHGDFACSIALELASKSKKAAQAAKAQGDASAAKPLAPRAIAEQLGAALGDAEGLLERTEVAGPGFLNLFVTDAAWRAGLGSMLDAGEHALLSNRHQGKKVLLEYVSANPTGPLHIAHGRGAVIGDVLGNLLQAVGWKVEREYYVNDLGNQTDVLARSIHWRYLELCGEKAEPDENCYPGEYVRDIAVGIHEDEGRAYVDADEAVWLPHFRSLGIAQMLLRIRADLDAFGIRFDTFVSERELTERKGLAPMLQRLEAAGVIEEREGKRWFCSTRFGDDKDRVVVRDDGRTTYFASDIAYHDDKMSRGFDRLINVFGADHGGYVARVKAGLQALGHGEDVLEVVLIQMVSLVRDGVAVRMGKRLGTAVWLKEVLDEAGKDATRYFFAMRRADAQMEFDVGLAQKKSIDNPVYYAQMGHARMCAIVRKAKAEGIAIPKYDAKHPEVLDALVLPEELSLIKTLLAAPKVVLDAAEALEPHQIAHYMQDLIGQFHSYYSQYKNTHRVVSADVAATQARLLLCQALQTVLAGLLGLLGVEAPIEMHLEEEAAA